MVSVGKRRKANALEEYRRIFGLREEWEREAFPGRQAGRNAPTLPGRAGSDAAAGPERELISNCVSQAEKAAWPRNEREDSGGSRRASSIGFDAAIWARLALVLVRGYHGVARLKLGADELIALVLACAIGFGARQL